MPRTVALCETCYRTPFAARFVPVAASIVKAHPPMTLRRCRVCRTDLDILLISSL